MRIGLTSSDSQPLRLLDEAVHLAHLAHGGLGPPLGRYHRFDFLAHGFDTFRVHGQVVQRVCQRLCRILIEFRWDVCFDRQMWTQTHHRGSMNSGEVDGENAEGDIFDVLLRFGRFGDKPRDQVVLVTKVIELHKHLLS